MTGYRVYFGVSQEDDYLIIGFSFFKHDDMHSYILQIRHEVLDFDRWKKAFENDPADRKTAGVRRYKIFRQIDSPDFVVIQLEFDDLRQAEEMLVSLQKLWTRVEGKLMVAPETRIMHLVESKDV
jgi:hypothetical protein